MSRLSQEHVRRIESALHAAGATLPCPRCGWSDITVLDGYIVAHAQAQLSNMRISGDNRVSCVVTICSGCGYMAQHAIDVLDGGAA